MKIVITGSESFVGRELMKQCQLLNFEISKIDLAQNLDIRAPTIDDQIFEKADALIHLAAVSFNYQRLTDIRELFDVNVLGTLNLIRAAKKRQIKKFIFASSEWVYGEGIGEEYKEDNLIDISKIKNPYALSKLISENNLKSELKNFCPVTILRFSIIYGPRKKNWSAVESLFNSVKVNTKVEVGSLKTARRFIHVQDVAASILAALSINDSDYEAYNVAGEELISLGQIIEISSRILSKKPQILELNPDNFNIRNPSNAKIKDRLNWQPTIDLETGLKTLL